MKDAGVIYAVTGEKYLSEVHTSLRSIKKTNPNIPITVFSDIRPDEEFLKYDNINYVDITGTEFQKRPKVTCLRETPYEKTIYLDSDTYVQENLEELFRFLNGFDLVCWNSGNNYESNRKYIQDKEFPGNISNEQEFRKRFEITTPRIMPDYNTGVIVYRMNDNVAEMLANWESIYRKHITLDIPGYYHDEPAFRQAVFEADVKACGALPAECNCRVRNLYESRGLVQIIQWQPIIVHGGSHDIEKAANKINKRIKNGGYIVKPENIANRIFEKGWLFIKSLQYDGFRPTLRQLKSYISKNV
jgi:hypothetical protein